MLSVYLLGPKKRHSHYTRGERKSAGDGTGLESETILAIEALKVLEFIFTWVTSGRSCEKDLRIIRALNSVENQNNGKMTGNSEVQKCVG